MFITYLNLTWVAVLALKWGLYYLVFFAFFWRSVNRNVHDYWHHHMLASLAPSPHLFFIYLRVAIWASLFVFQPSVYAFSMEVMLALCHKHRAGVEAYWTYLSLLVYMILCMPVHIWIVGVNPCSIVDLYLGVVLPTPSIFILRMNLLRSSPCSYVGTDHKAKHHAYGTADGGEYYHKDAWLLST